MITFGQYPITKMDDSITIYRNDSPIGSIYPATRSIKTRFVIHNNILDIDELKQIIDEAEKYESNSQNRKMAI